VFHPAIEGREAIEVWGEIHRKSRIAGVSRATSAAARRARGVRWERRRWSRARSSALTAPASMRAASPGWAEEKIAARSKPTRQRSVAGAKTWDAFSPDSQRSMAWQFSQARAAKNIAEENRIQRGWPGTAAARPMTGRAQAEVNRRPTRSSLDKKAAGRHRWVG